MARDPLVDEAESLLQHYRAEGRPESLLRAHELLVRGTQEDPRSSARFTTLSRVLRDIHVRTNDIVHLDAAIVAAEAAVTNAAADDPDLVVYLNNLGQVCADRYEQNSDESDLEAADSAYRAAIRIAPTVGVLFGGLSTVVKCRYDLTGDLAVLHEAIDLGRKAVMLSFAPDQRAMSQSQLSALLFSLYRHVNDMSALYESAEVARDASGVASASAEDRATYLIRWGIALCELATVSLDRAVLEQASHVLERALAVIPSTGRQRAGVLLSLGNVRRDQYRSTGHESFLDDAVALISEALANTAEGDLDFGGILYALATTLRARASRTGSPEDLETAIEQLERSARAAPAQDPFTPMVRSMLGGLYLDRARRRLDPRFADGDVRAGLRHLRQAVDDTPLSSAGRPVLVNNFVTGLIESSERSGDPAPLAEARRLCIEQLNTDRLTPQGYELLAVTLTKVALTQVDAGLPITVLDEPEMVLRGLIAASDRQDDTKSTMLGNLAQILHHRLCHGRNTERAAEMVGLRRTIVEMPAAAPLTRIGHAIALARHLAEEGDWDGALNVYRRALDLLGTLAPRAWRHEDRLAVLSEVGELASDAAACALQTGQPALAVEFFEQGRGVIVDHPHLERQWLERLREVSGELAARYADALRAIEVASSGQQRDDAHRRHEQVLDEIRLLGGDLGTFLTPPPCERLVAALGDRTVVLVNVSRIRSDAIVLGRGEVRVVPLPRLDHAAMLRQVVLFLTAVGQIQDEATATEAAQAMRAALTWLWQTAARPVLTALGVATASSAPQRIWWCPAGLLSTVPLHAAGHYPACGTVPAPGESTLDRVVSSYTPTVRMFVESALRPVVRTGPPSVLAVGVADAPPQPPLPTAKPEALAVHRQVGRGTVLIDAQATRERILGELPAHQWFHFAGHGVVRRYEQDSACLLPFDYDGGRNPLSGKQVSALSLSGAELAFLSACETARGRIDLANEPVHLSGAFQQAGYRQVVATSWPIEGEFAGRVAFCFYADLRGDADRAAYALHGAIRAAREQHEVFHWASFVHSGV